MHTSWLQPQLPVHHLDWAIGFNHHASGESELAYPSAHSDFSGDSVNTPSLWKHRSKSDRKPDIQGEYFSLKNKLNKRFYLQFDYNELPSSVTERFDKWHGRRPWVKNLYVFRFYYMQEMIFFLFFFLFIAKMKTIDRTNVC